MSGPVIVVHGGCGSPASGRLRDEDGYHRELSAAVDAAAAGLDSGGAAVDAAQAAVQVLEDAPQFNAGRGSVLTVDGGVEMDAAVMTGHDRRAGAVAVVTTVRNPVALARDLRLMGSVPQVEPNGNRERCRQRPALAPGRRVAIAHIEQQGGQRGPGG